MLTTVEVAEIFHISRVQATRWARRFPKQLGAMKMTPGGPWRWPEARVRHALINGLHEEE